MKSFLKENSLNIFMDEKDARGSNTQSRMNCRK